MHRGKNWRERGVVVERSRIGVCNEALADKNSCLSTNSYNFPLICTPQPLSLLSFFPFPARLSIKRGKTLMISVDRDDSFSSLSFINEGNSQPWKFSSLIDWWNSTWIDRFVRFLGAGLCRPKKIRWWNWRLGRDLERDLESSDELREAYHSFTSLHDEGHKLQSMHIAF